MLWRDRDASVHRQVPPHTPKPIPSRQVSSLHVQPIYSYQSDMAPIWLVKSPSGCPHQDTFAVSQYILTVWWRWSTGPGSPWRAAALPLWNVVHLCCGCAATPHCPDTPAASTGMAAGESRNVIRRVWTAIRQHQSLQCSAPKLSCGDDSDGDDDDSIKNNNFIDIKFNDVLHQVNYTFRKTQLQEEL